MVLATDHTLEHELFTILSPFGVGCFFSRLEIDNKVTPETLFAMRDRIGASASLILPGTKLDMIAYGCTSAAATIGEEEVFSQLSSREEFALKTTPIASALSAFKALNTQRLGLVTPYIGAVNDILIKYIEEQGNLRVTNLVSFNLIKDTEVARVTEESIKKAAIKVAMMDNVDTVFISCTSLRTKNIVKDVENETGKLVTSSNMSMAWHIARKLGIDADISHMYGKLFSL